MATKKKTPRRKKRKQQRGSSLIGSKEKLVRICANVPDRVKVSLEKSAKELGEDRNELVRHAIINYTTSRRAERELLALVMDNGLSSGAPQAIDNQYWKKKGIAHRPKARVSKNQIKIAELRIRPAADNDIDSAADGIARTSAPLAEDFPHAVRTTIEHIADLPEAGSPFHFGTPSRLRRCCVAGFPSVVVFYYVGKNGIDILRVLDATEKGWGLILDLF